MKRDTTFFLAAPCKNDMAALLEYAMDDRLMRALKALRACFDTCISADTPKLLEARLRAVGDLAAIAAKVKVQLPKRPTLNDMLQAVSAIAGDPQVPVMIARYLDVVASYVSIPDVDGCVSKACPSVPREDLVSALHASGAMMGVMLDPRVGKAFRSALEAAQKRVTAAAGALEKPVTKKATPKKKK